MDPITKSNDFLSYQWNRHDGQTLVPADMRFRGAQCVKSKKSKIGRGSISPERIQAMKEPMVYCPLFCDEFMENHHRIYMLTKKNLGKQQNLIPLAATAPATSFPSGRYPPSKQISCVKPKKSFQRPQSAHAQTKKFDNDGVNTPTMIYHCPRFKDKNLLELELETYQLLDGTEMKQQRKYAWGDDKQSSSFQLCKTLHDIHSRNYKVHVHHYHKAREMHYSYTDML
jgi:hypothetical protein